MAFFWWFNTMITNEWATSPENNFASVTMRMYYLTRAFRHGNGPIAQ